MLSIKPCLGGWIAGDGSGTRYNDAQAFKIIYRESLAFMESVKKHLMLEQCSCCKKWGKLDFDVHVLHAGAKPICLQPDCIGARLHDDYTSTDIISIASLRRRGAMDDPSWETATAIEPLIQDVLAYIYRIECYRGTEHQDKRIHKHFAKDFAEIGAAAAESVVVKAEWAGGE